MREERTWRGHELVRVDSERLYTLHIGHLAPKLRIPSFQRGYVWGPQDAILLLESIVLGYPIGGIILWDPDGGTWGLSSERLIVLDGQQRLTTLAGSLLDGGFGNVPRVVYDVEADGFMVTTGELTPDQISIKDLGDNPRRSAFWMKMLDRHPDTFPPHLTEEQQEERRAVLWEGIAPGIPLPRTKAAIKARGKELAGLASALRADDDDRRAQWDRTHPGAKDWMHRLDFIERRLRDHQTSVTVVRGGKLADVREIFQRLNTAGRPLDEEGVRALLEGS